MPWLRKLKKNFSSSQHSKKVKAVTSNHHQNKRVLGIAQEAKDKAGPEEPNVPATEIWEPILEENNPRQPSLLLKNNMDASTNKPDAVQTAETSLLRPISEIWYGVCEELRAKEETHKTVTEYEAELSKSFVGALATPIAFSRVGKLERRQQMEVVLRQRIKELLLSYRFRDPSITRGGKSVIKSLATEDDSELICSKKENDFKVQSLCQSEEFGTNDS